ncbi:MAG: radical SAM protein [Pseudomonadota bacterium]
MPPRKKTAAGRRPTRVLLVKAHHDDPSIRQVTHPLGIMYVAACLKRDYGHDVRIFDMRVNGFDYARLEEEIRSFSPDIVGISALTSETGSMDKIAACAKKVNHGTPVILGGPHATAYGDQSITSPDIDYGVVGEGEITAGRLIERLTAKRDVDDLKGLVFRRDGNVVNTGRAELVENLDDLPPPAYDLIPIGEYKKFYRFSRTGRGDYMCIFSSRACPYRCIYCHNIFGKKFRARSAESLVSEIRHLYDRYGIREFEILDDIFNFDRKRVLEFCDRVVESGMNITLAFPNGLRGDLLDEEQLRKLKQAGTIYIALAIETASVRMQKVIRKNINIEKVRRNIEIARSLRIHSHGFFMMSLPGETLEEMKMTVDFILSSKLHTFNLFMAMPFEGTEMGRMAREMGRDVVTDFSQDYYTRKFVNLTDVPGDVINEIRRNVLLRFYANPVRIYNIMRDFPGDASPLRLAKLFFRRMLWKT